MQNELESVLVKKVYKGWRNKPTNIDHYKGGVDVGTAKTQHRRTEGSKKNVLFLLFGIAFILSMVFVIVLIKKCKKTQSYRKLKVEFLINESHDEGDSEESVSEY